MKPRITNLPSLRLGGHNHSHLSLVLRRGLDPNPRPFPSPGEGMQPVAFGDFFSPWQSRNKFHFAHSHPLARSLRYPRPIKESRGDSLRNRVAIVCVRSAHLNANNHPILVLVAIVRAGSARGHSYLVINSSSIFGEAAKYDWENEW